MALMQKRPRAPYKTICDPNYYSPKQRLCNKALSKTLLRIVEIPDVTLLAGAAQAGTEPLRRPTRARATLARGPILTYGLTRDDGQRFGARDGVGRLLLGGGRPAVVAAPETE
jgi:hypothetical protein